MLSDCKRCGFEPHLALFSSLCMFASKEKIYLLMLSLGHLSPAVITPRGLKKLLIEIESYLPEFLKLPYDPKGKIWKFYQTLSSSTVLDESRFFNF